MKRRTFGISMFAAAWGVAAPQVMRPVRPIRFAMWNIAGAAEGYHGRGREGIAAWLRENAVDVCVMQEVDRYSRQSDYVDFPDYFAKATGFDAYYAQSSVEPPTEPGRMARQYGNLILSRWPLTERRVVNLRGPRTADDPLWGQDNRIGLIARARGVYWATTHLSYIENFVPHAIPATQALNLRLHLDEVVPEGAPLVLGGDLNSSFESPNLADMRAHLRGHTRDVGPTWPLDYTQPLQDPRFTLDHIFTRAVRVEHVRREEWPELSDHAAVLADIIPETRELALSL